MDLTKIPGFLKVEYLKDKVFIHLKKDTFAQRVVLERMFPQRLIPRRRDVYELNEVVTKIDWLPYTILVQGTAVVPDIVGGRAKYDFIRERIV